MIRHLCIALVLAALAATQAVAEWTLIAAMPSAREKVATCAIDDTIYVIGGEVSANGAGLTTNEAYHAASGQWTDRAPMPTGRRALVAGVVNGICYVIGGHVSALGDGLTTVEAYNPLTNTWAPRAPMPTGRFFPAAAVLDGKIYVLGGTPDGQNISDVAEVYDPATNTWASLPPMPTPRAVLAAASANGRVYAFGGTNSPGAQEFGTVEVYDPGTNSWTALTSMPTPRAGPSAVTVGGRIHVAGGLRTGSALNIVEVFDPGAGTWTSAASMLAVRIWFGLDTLDGALYAFGGGQTAVPPHPAINLAETYTPAAASLVVNAGMNDAWYNPSTPGQGFFINVFPDLGLVFFAWFTYDTARPAQDVTAILGEPGHRWLTAIGPFSGDTVTLDVELTQGGVFDAALPAPVQTPAYGTITLVFADCSNGTLSYDFPSLGLSGQIPIQRIVPDNVPLCEALSNG